MPNKNLFLRVIFILLFLKVFTGNAQTVKSGEITWKYLSEEKYEINLTLYKFCTGLDFDTVQKIEILTLDSTVKDSFKIDLYRKSVQSISFLCDTVKNSCDTSLGNGFKLTEKHVFSQILDFNAGRMKQWLDSGACLFRFYYKNYNRDFHSTLTSTYSNSTFEVDAEINYCGIKSSYQAVSDNSPYFTNPPLLLNYCNIPFENHDGGFDKDKDSIVYSLEAPLWNKYSEVGYIVSLSKNIPLSNYCRGPNQFGQCVPRPKRNPPEGFYFNTKTGEYVYMPFRCSEKGVLVVKASQYKLDSSGHRWIYTGFVKREISITTIISSNNNHPRLSSSDISPMCEGEKKCFKIEFEDEEFNGFLGKQAWIDTISLTWNNIFKNSTLSIDSHYMFNDNGLIYAKTHATLCIQTEIGDASPVPYYLSITARDKMCPSNAVTRKAIELYVNPYSPKAKILLEEKTCGKFSLKIEKQNPYPYRDTIKVQWLVLDSMNKTIAQGTTLQDSFVLPSLGRYYVQLNAKYSKSNCSISTIDTIFGKMDSTKWTYLVPRLHVASDTLQCFKNHKFELMDSSIVFGGSIVQKYWVLSDKDTIYNQNLSLVFDTIGKYKAKLFLMSNIGCEYTDSLYLNLNGSRIDSVHFTDTALCFRNNLFVGKAFATEADSVTYSWTISDNPDSMYLGNEINKVFQNPGNYEARLIVTSSDYCADTFFQNLTVFTQPYASVQFEDTVMCFKNNLFLGKAFSTDTNSVTYSWNFSDNPDSIYIGNEINKVFQNPGNYEAKLIVTSSDYCPYIIFQNLTVFAQPSVSVHFADTAMCYRNNLFVGKAFSTDADSVTCSWTISDNPDSMYLGNEINKVFQNPGNYEARLIVTSSDYCADTFFQNLTVFTQPSVSVQFEDTVMCFKNHEFKGEAFATGTNPIVYNWRYNDNPNNIYIGSNSQKSFKFSGKYTLQLDIVDSNNCTDTVQQKLNVLTELISNLSFNDTFYCGDKNKEFIGTAVARGASPIDYQWRISDSPDSIYKGAELRRVFPTFGSFSVDLIISDNNQCSDTFSSNLHVFAKPTASIKALSDLSQCSKNSLFKFADSSTIENGKIASNKWSYINNTLIDMDILEFGLSFPGIVKVYLETSSDNNCKSSDSINVEVFESPIYSQVVGDALVWLKDTVTYSCPNYIGHYYTWNFSETMGKGLSSSINVKNYRIQWLDTGRANVYCKYYKDPRCVDSSILRVFIQQKPEPVSTKDLDSKDLLFCFPNPVSDVLTLPEGQTFAMIHVYDELGKLIIQSKGTGQLSLVDLVTGVYIVEGVLPNGTKVRNKVLKINP